MKSLFAAVVVAAACSVSVSAFAQSSAADSSVNTQATTAQAAQDQSAPASNSADDRYARTRNQSGRYDRDPNCVGPVSFCNLYFGS